MNGGQRPPLEPNEYIGKHDPSRPPPRRMETDPAAWQHESSVRHMQEPTIPFANAPQGSPQGTPPLKWRNTDDGRQSPYRQHIEAQVNSSENVDRSQQQRREWRNSGWNRQNGGVATGT